MTINAQLFDDKYALVDDRTAKLGGSFYFEPLRSYSPTPLKWAYEQLIRYPRATLLDIGASTGCYSLLAAHHPGLEVWAFEPVPLTCQVLRSNVALNNLTGRVKTFGKAISNYEGMGILHSIKDMGGSGVSIVDGTPAVHKDCIDSRVNVTTIDKFCKRHKIVPTLIKIDVEGNEKAVLEGATETIERFKPFLLFEHSVENANQFGINPADNIAMIEKWGYVWSNPEQTDILATSIGWETLVNAKGYTE